MRIAVVIVNWNSGALLDRCLEGLRLQTRPADRIVVADNGSSDGSLDALRRLPTVEVLPLGRNAGFAAANNCAVQMVADCEWIALLNPDAVPTPTWLAALEVAVRANPGYACFGSQMRRAAEPERLDGVGDVYHVSGRVWRDEEGRPLDGAAAPREIFSACAAAALYSRAAFLAAGGFDESFFCYLEDVDLGFRLRLEGERSLYVPDAVVYHLGSGVSGRHSDFSVYHGHRNLVWTYFKNMPRSLMWAYLPQHLVMNLVSVAWFAAHGQGRVIVKAKVDAVRGLGRILAARRPVQARPQVSARELRRMMARGVLAPYLVPMWRRPT
jgi:GT2 family glycosyltransferase